MSPSSPHAAPHGVTLTLRLVALPTLCGVASNGLLVATTLYGESIPPFRKSQKNFSAFRRHYSSWPPTVGASGEFRYIYRSSSLSDNVQPSSLTPRHSDPSPPAWPQRRRRGIVHVTHILRWSGGIDGSMFDVPTTPPCLSRLVCFHHFCTAPFTSDLDRPSGCLDRSVRFPDPPFLVSAIFLTTFSVQRLSLEALGVLLRAFPSAVAAARPSSLSDLRPTAVYGWTVSVDLPGSYGKSPIGNPYYHTINCVPGPVHCIAENGIWLAVGSGKAIQLVKQATIATWECTRLLPDPIKFPELDGELPEPMARSLHFLGGGSLLLVTYLDHGVIAWNLKTLEIKWHIRPCACKIGCSIVSHNEKILALTNLYDGIDWYSLDSNHFMDASYQHTTTHPIPDNVILPITFVHGNSAVLSGTSDGCARITTVTDWALAERLRHNRELFIIFLSNS
ncbi:hypothetical protein EDB85DRAFT_1889470 [Lactarius pseudohatsudake]|nr:hypothetical protein EDB85DRAFT_1889470 [Lactarius pseudohatsudake]